MPRSSLPIKRMTERDIASANRLTQDIGWAYHTRSWRRVLNWAGRGAYVMFVPRTKQIVGSALAMQYGTQRGWIGLITVHPRFRQRGFGTELSETALTHLQARGVEEIMLDASTMGKPIYEDLGFRHLYTVKTWQGFGGRVDDAPLRPTMRRATSDDREALIALDASIFGAPRPHIIGTLIEGEAEHLLVDDENGTLTGMVGVIRRTPQVVTLGPLMHREEAGAFALVSAALERIKPSQTVKLTVPHSNPHAMEVPKWLGFTSTGTCTRMVWGSAQPSEDALAHFGILSMVTG